MDLLPVQPFQETLNAGMCGPASLKMVLSYWGIEADEAELAKKLNHSPELGVTDLDIERVAKEYGLAVSIQNNSSFDDIRYWLNRKVPVLVDWFTSGRKDYPDEVSVPEGHLSVVVGLDDTHIYLQDPEIGGLRKLERGAFEHVWFDFEGALIESNELIIRQLIAIYPKEK